MQLPSGLWVTQGDAQPSRRTTVHAWVPMEMELPLERGVQQQRGGVKLDPTLRKPGVPPSVEHPSAEATRSRQILAHYLKSGEGESSKTEKN